VKKIDEVGKLKEVLIKWKGFTNPVWEETSVFADAPESLYK